MLGSRIDLGNPVADHPLNYGLTAWWLPLSNNSFGSRLFDLCGRNPGTLTNGPTWAAGPNGFAAVQFDGANDYIDCPSATATPSRGTLAFWLHPGFNPSTSGAATYYVLDTQGGTARTLFYKNNGNTSWGLYVGGTLISDTTGSSLANLAPGFAWTHISVSWGGGTVAVYRNGQTFASFSSSPGAGGGGLRWGARHSGTEPWLGLIADQRAYSRALSASEVWGLYDQSRRGHPDALRRWSPRARLFVPGSPPPPPSAPPPNPAVRMLACGLL